MINYGLFILLLFIQLPTVSSVGLAEELYCGLQTCYDVLQIPRDEFDPKGLSKIYRALAKKHHPDRAKQAEKVEAEARFRLIATAYETLKDEQTRKDYDYYLDHPEERFYNYYQYYRRKMVPKVDVRLVILGTILSISLFQYYSAKQKYSEALAYALTVGKFRNMAINLGVDRGLLQMDAKGKLKKLPNVNNEDVIKQIVAENLNVSGGYKKESVYDTLMWHTIILPLTIFRYIVWYSKWVMKYWIKREEYDEEAKLYLIRKQLNVSEAQFKCMEEYEISEMLKRELWIPSNFKEWKTEKEAKEKEKLMNSGRYKQYKRYMKSNAGNTISFVDED